MTRDLLPFESAPSLAQVNASWSYCRRGNEAVLTTASSRSVLKLTPANTTCAVEIPAVMDGLPVTEVGDSAFLNCRALPNPVIPESVTMLGTYALKDVPVATFEGLPPQLTSPSQVGIKVIRYHTRHASLWEAAARTSPWKNATFVRIP